MTAALLLSLGAHADSSRFLEERIWKGMGLAEALGVLEEAGLSIVFNSRVVGRDLEVAAEPSAKEPLGILEEILEPHGLTFRDGPSGRLVVIPKDQLRRVDGWVRSRGDGQPISGAVVEPADGQPLESAEDGSFSLELPWGSDLSLQVRAVGFAPRELFVRRRALETPLFVDLSPLPKTFDEIAVTPSRLTLRRQRVGEPMAVGQDVATSLPGLADDPVRGLKALPGITASDTSARLSVRGGPEDGTQLFLDGVELLDPFHLQDFGGASSIIAPEVIETIELSTGTVPAEHRGRAGGVVDMHSVNPRNGDRLKIGLGVLDSHVLGSGRLPSERGHWLGLGRLGTFDPALRFDGRRDRPDFWDVFAKAEVELGEPRRLTTRTLVADDHLNFLSQDESSLESLETRYRSYYLWSTLEAPLSEQLYSETTVSFTGLDRKRFAQEASPLLDFALEDVRSLDQVGLRQDFSYFLTPRQTLALGLDVRQVEARFRYRSEVENLDPLAALRTGSGSGTFEGDLKEEQWSVYASDVYRPFASMTLHLGLRFEEYTLTDRSDLTPRVAVAFWLPGERVLRLSWGSFVQNQRPYELQLTDGETDFALGERSEQTILSFEQPLGRGVTLRAEAYRRTTSNPRPRFVNLFEPRTAVPEVQGDRFRISPERSEAQGVELLLRGIGARQGWWVHYARSRSRNRIGGERVPSPVDQPDALAAHYQRRFGNHWIAGAVWRFHAGWPTTQVEVEAGTGAGGETLRQPQLGRLFSDRLPTYHRLDLRLSREWKLPKGKLETHVEVQNAYNRRNIRGYELEWIEGPEEARIDRQEKFWRGSFASAGISWAF